MMARIKQFLIAERGVALIELAFVLPFIFLLLWGSIEITRYITIAQRVDKSAYTIADIVSQYLPATPARAAGEISQAALQDDVFPQLRRLLSPHDAEGDRIAILTSVRNEGGRLLVKWQLAGGGSLGGTAVRSLVNGAGPALDPGVRNSPANFSGDAAALLTGPSGMAEGENMIVAEVFFHYRPLLRRLLLSNRTGEQLDIGEAILVRRLFIRPRRGDLDQLPPSFGGV